MVHVLVIDDDTSNLVVVQEFLGLMGISGVVTQDPTSVVNNLTSLQNIDLILLDLEMPSLNGYEMLEILRQHVDIPIIACSIHINEMNNARAMGFDGFLGKPLSRKQFADQIQRILNGESVWEAN